MFWKLITLALLLWAVGMYFSMTLGGLIHLLPAAAIVCVVVRRISKPPDTEYGRWRSAAERISRRRPAAIAGVHADRERGINR